MSDRVAESTLAVDVSGEEAINRLTAALDRLQQSAVNVQRAVSAAGTQAAGASASAQIASVTQQATGEAGSLGVKLGEAFGRAIGTSIRAPFDALKSTAEIAGRSLMSFAGPLGEIAGKTGPAAAAVVGFTAAVTGLAVPIANLIAGFKLLRDSFGWAKDAAEEQLRVAARTRRFMPGVMGEGVEAAEQEMRARMGVMTSLFGSAADSMQQNVTRRFTEYRLGKGLRGEADIFERWGITPEAIQRMEQTGQRVDLTEWLRMFILKREELEQQLQRPGISAEERAGVEKRLGMFADDTTKMFNQKFSDMALAMGSADVDRLKANLEAALPIGHVEGATQKAINFTIALESLKATFGELTFGIGGDVQPAITTFLETINTKLTQTDATGRSVAIALRELASSMATNAWQVLKSIMDQIDVPRINSWLQTIQSWQPAETAETIKGLITGVLDFGRAIWSLIQAVNNLVAALPDWLKPGATGNPFAAGLQAAGLSPGGGGEGAQPLPGVNWVRRQFGAEPLGGGGGGGGAPAGAPAGAGAPPVGITGQANQATGGWASPARLAGPPVTPPTAATTPPATAPAPQTAATGPPPAPAQQARDLWSGLGGAPRAGAQGTPGSAAAPGAVAPAAQAPAPGPPSAPPQPAAQPGLGTRAWEGIKGAFSMGQPAQTAAPGPPPPAPQGPAAGSDQERYGLPGLTAPRVGKPQWGAQGFNGPAPGAPNPPSLGEASRGIPNTAGSEAPPLPTTGPSPTAIEAAKGAAAGTALRLSTNVESDNTGTYLSMKATTPEMAGRRYVPGSNIEIATPEEQRLQMTNAMLQRRAIRGTGELPSERTVLTTPPTMQDRWTGGMTAQDGAEFGNAAGQAVRDQLQGVNIPYGPASTSYGVSPRSAPKPTGGDTATEA